MKNFSESDRRGGALFGIVGCMAILLINCIWSTGSQSMILFCISCTAMFSMMQLADDSSPGFTRKYRWLMYFFAFAPCAWATSHLVRERARILEDLGAFVVPTLFIGFFLSVIRGISERTELNRRPLLKHLL